MAEADFTSESWTFEYQQLAWGDLIIGHKQDLQAFGLAIDRAYPGEAGGPKRVLHVTDPRGLPCRISKWIRTDERFMASIRFPGRERPDELARPFAPGVTAEAMLWGDLYEGQADDLIRAGLLRPDQFPGTPGRCKTVAHYGPDGGPSRTNPPLLAPAGAMTVRKQGRGWTVSVCVGVEEYTRRAQAHARHEQAAQQAMQHLPRPAPLIRLTAAEHRRSMMRLVWDRGAT